MDVCVRVCACVCALAAVLGVVSGAMPGSPETHRKPMEAHHSLHHPFDATSVYWKYGGSTVMRRKAARIVPATQSRTGWLWNDYPLESADWEVEVSTVYSMHTHCVLNAYALHASIPRCSKLID